MKPHLFTASVLFILMLFSSPAGAWTHWYYQNLPYAPIPGFWFYQNIPQGPAMGPAFGQMPPPWFWFVQPNPAIWWTMPSMTSGFFVEQGQTPIGYNIRVYSPDGTAQSLEIGVEGGVIVIKRQNVAQGAPMQPSGWTTRWISLPADANLAAMQMSRSGVVVEIFVPRFG